MDKDSGKNSREQIDSLKKRIKELEKLEAQHKWAQDSLLVWQKKSKMILENINDVIFQLSPLGVIEYVSPGVEKLYGYKAEELIGKHLKKTTPLNEVPKALEVINMILQGEAVKPFEINQIDNRGRLVLIEVNAQPIMEEGEIVAIQGVMRDITERKKSEEELKNAYEKLKQTQQQLIQSAKMASVGVLAAGVAHDINNPLSVISGEARMLQDNNDKEAKEASKIILEQANRIKEITGSLLEFSRQKEVEYRPTDVNQDIEKSISLLTFQAKLDKIKIKKELDANLPKPLAYENQLQEVFLNIMLNAVQAMKNGGILTVRTYSEIITDYGRRRTDKFKPQEKIVVIEIKDTGEGMDEEALMRVFEPFFTTKERGTGLGLFVCYGIIEKCRGAIEVKSKLGKGSTFIVKLPVV
ncbi:MAG: PAS domain S-box protein [Candidatus Omnitrophota bacterium]